MYAFCFLPHAVTHIVPWVECIELACLHSHGTQRDIFMMVAVGLCYLMPGGWVYSRLPWYLYVPSSRWRGSSSPCWCTWLFPQSSDVRTILCGRPELPAAIATRPSSPGGAMPCASDSGGPAPFLPHTSMGYYPPTPTSIFIKTVLLGKLIASCPCESPDPYDTPRWIG